VQLLWVFQCSHLQFLLLRKWRQKNHKFEAILGYIVRPCLKKLKPNKQITLHNVWHVIKIGRKKKKTGRKENNNQGNVINNQGKTNDSSRHSVDHNNRLQHFKISMINVLKKIKTRYGSTWL
jgi:hypothetical protein